MSVHISKLEEFNLIPCIYGILSSVKEFEYSYKHYEIRHPAAIFSIRFLDILNYYKLLCDHVQQMQTPGLLPTTVGKDKAQLLMQQFLFEFFNYFECGYEIFLCFCNQLTLPDFDQPLHKWFHAHGYDSEVSSYFQNLNPLLVKYRKFWNGLKHSSNRIRILTKEKEDSSIVVLGCYLEGINKEGAISAAVDLHPLHNGEYTAWSCNFILREFYYLIYKISDEIKNTVAKLCKKHNITLPDNKIGPDQASFEHICKDNAVMMMKFQERHNTYFFQEYEEAIWSSKYIEKNMKIFFIRSHVVPLMDDSWNILMTTKGDGFTRGFCYFRK
jgi:hypothetical protein